MALRHAGWGECEHRYSISISSIQGCTPRTDLSVLPSKQNETKMNVREFWIVYHTMTIVYDPLSRIKYQNREISQVSQDVWETGDYIWTLILFSHVLFYFFYKWFMVNCFWVTSTWGDKKCQFMTLCLSNTLENLIWCELFLIFWEYVSFLPAHHVFLERPSFSKYAPCSFTPSNALSACYKSERHGDQSWSRMILLIQKAHSCLPLEQQ